MSTALFDPARRYRYRLTRTWDPSLPTVTFVMLNPSTADAERDDPTIRRCTSFARTWGFGALVVVNLFALRTPYPDRLRRARDPVGPDNDRHILRAVRASHTTVLAWGAHGAIRGRDGEVLALIARRQVCRIRRCLGVTRGGQPRHPLYLPRHARPVPFPAASAARPASSR